LWQHSGGLSATTNNTITFQSCCEYKLPAADITTTISTFFKQTCAKWFPSFLPRFALDWKRTFRDKQQSFYGSDILRVNHTTMPETFSE